MTDLVISVFRLTCKRLSPVPHVSVGYRERQSGDEWHVLAGGSRAYAVRISDALSEDHGDQSADSHFIIRRLTATLLMGGAGLYQAEATGRFMIHRIDREFPWTVHLDEPDPDAAPLSEEQNARFQDWWSALTQHTVLRRAAEDAHLALSLPHEALIFVYRGMEWIVKHFGIRWETLAHEIGVPRGEIRVLKQLANDETGVRHGSRSGQKLRAMLENYGSWVCALVEAINVARERLEPEYVRMTSQVAGRIIAKAVAVVPYE